MEKHWSGPGLHLPDNLHLASQHTGELHGDDDGLCDPGGHCGFPLPLECAH